MTEICRIDLSFKKNDYQYNIQTNMNLIIKDIAKQYFRIIAIW